MSDLIQPHLHASPWCPGPDIEIVETFNYYNMPISGLLRQGGVDYLFRCLAGEILQANLWLYAPLTQFELESLDEADNEALPGRIDELSTRRSVTMGFATQDKLKYWLDVPVESSVYDATQRFFSQYQRDLEEERDGATAMASVVPSA